MVWRDLDIYLETDGISSNAFFELGSRLNTLFRPTRMHFLDSRTVAASGLPRGLYWGVYQNHQREDSWKIDVWALDRENCQQRIEFLEKSEERLTLSSRSTILDMKSQVWRDTEYWKTFAGLDVYNAVLDHGVVDVAGFREYLLKPA